MRHFVSFSQHKKRVIIPDPDPDRVQNFVYTFSKPGSNTAPLASLAPRNEARQRGIQQLANFFSNGLLEASFRVTELSK